MKRPFNAIQLTPNGKHCKHGKILSFRELTTVRKWIRWKNVPACEILSRAAAVSERLQKT